MKGTTFENELRQIFDDMEYLTDKKYVGKVFCGRINSDLQIKASFVWFDRHDYNSALKVEVVSHNDDVIDTNIIQFDEIWRDKKDVKLRDWGDGNFFWIGHYPTAKDMKMIADEVADVVLNYQEQTKNQACNENMGDIFHKSMEVN